MTPDTDDTLDEIPSPILISRQEAELLSQLLNDLDGYLRQPAVFHLLQQAARLTDPVSPDYLTDVVSFQALRWREILAAPEPAGAHPSAD